MLTSIITKKWKAPKALLVLAWVNLFIGIAFYFFQYALRTSITALSPEIETTFSITPDQLGNIAASYFYIFVATQFFAGSLIDKYGVRLILIFSSLLCAAGAVMFGVANHQAWLYMGRIFMGAGSAFSLILALTIIERLFSEKLIPVLIGITGAIGIFGAVIGEVAISVLSQHFDWHMIMIIGGVACMLIAISAFLLLFPHHKTKKIRAKQQMSMAKMMMAVLKNKALWHAFIFIAVMTMVIDLLASLWGVPYLIKHYGFTVIQSERINAMILIGFGLGSIVLSICSRKVGPVMVMRISSLCCLLFLCAYLFIAQGLVSHIIFALLLGFSVGSISLVFIYVGRVADKKTLATAFSITEVAKHLLSAVLIQVFGYMVAYIKLPINGWNGYTLPFILVVLLIGIGCLSTFFMKRLDRSQW